MNSNDGTLLNEGKTEPAGRKAYEPWKERVEYIDFIKAIAIVYVILGHINFANEAIKPWVMRVSVCAFFYVSGVFLKGNGAMTLSEWKYFVGKKFRALMVPYYLWAVIFTAFTVSNLAKIIYASYQMIEDSGSSGVLWFFPVLFLCFLMYACCRMAFQNRFTTTVKIILIVVTFGIAFLLPQVKYGYPMGVNSAFSAFGFFLMGNIAFPYMQRFHQYVSKNWVGLCICILAACVSFAGTLLYRLNPASVSMATGKYGNVALFLVVAIAGIMFTISIALIIDKVCFPKIKKWIAYIGRNSLAVCVLHILVVKVAEMAFQRVQMPDWAELIITCGFAITFSCVGNWLISMFAPVLLGKSEKR